MVLGIDTIMSNDLNCKGYWGEASSLSLSLSVCQETLRNTWNWERSYESDWKVHISRYNVAYLATSQMLVRKNSWWSHLIFFKYFHLDLISHCSSGGEKLDGKASHSVDTTEPVNWGLIEQWAVSSNLQLHYKLCRGFGSQMSEKILRVIQTLVQQPASISS